MPIESSNELVTSVNFQEREELEGTLKSFASMLPEIMNDPELNEIFYQEANNNIEDEAYALWSKIADKQTSSGKTCRKEIENILKKKRYKTRGRTSVLESFDKNERLQVYFHNFEKWEKTDRLNVAYEPLTINDVDVTELTVFKLNDESFILDVSDKNWEPDYPIAIVGFNESINFDDNQDNNKIATKVSGVTTSNIWWTWIEVRKPRDLEPWYKGKANMRVQRVPNQLNNSSMNVSNPSGQSCATKKTDNSPVMLIDYGSSTTIRVIEFDLFGWPEWIIDSADLTVESGYYSLSDIDPGKYYSCGINDRCRYTFILD